MIESIKIAGLLIVCTVVGTVATVILANVVLDLWGEKER